jgi:hypothetical protein
VVLAKWDGSALLGKKHSEAGMEEVRLVLGADRATLIESIQSSQGTTTMVWHRR